MPLELQPLDNRKYADLLEEALARIPVHNPEWTNFNTSDPGVTIIELWAFLTESLLYRVNQIPDRNRRKFLSLLGVPLQPATSSRGIVTISTKSTTPLITLSDGLEVRAGQIPFLTDSGLDVLPIEAQMYYKRSMDSSSPELRAHYNQLYGPLLKVMGRSEPQLYETAPFPQPGNVSVDLGKAVDQSLWIALLAPQNTNRTKIQQLIAGKTLNLGIVPFVVNDGRQLLPGGQANPEALPYLQYFVPDLSQGNKLPEDKDKRLAAYKPLDARSTTNVLAQPGIVEITLPAKGEQLDIWQNLDSLEVGADNFPPAIEDSQVNQRVITWIRVASSTLAPMTLLWAGINAVTVTQQARVVNELLPEGTGEPDQVVTLSKTPVVPDSVHLRVTTTLSTNESILEEWQRIDDLMNAGSEVAVRDTRLPPGTTKPTNTRSKVFVLDPESGSIRFGDGMRGARPPFGATMRVDYAYSVGSAGNLGPGAITSSPALPGSFAVTNPLPTWGGANAEGVSEGEKQITRYLQHRDRLVSVADFEAITLRTPGVDIGRVDVIPTYHPELGPSKAGDAPGAVTLMVIPSYDPLHPDAPQPNDDFLDAICSYLEPRRLVTTEVFVRGPEYVDVWISIGINVVTSTSIAQVREAVKKAIGAFLSPLPASPGSQLLDVEPLLEVSQPLNTQRGWPREKAVLAAELAAVASRVPGVVYVNGVLLTAGTDTVTQVDMKGRQLPHIAGIAVTVGSPLDPALLQGQSGPLSPSTKYLPVPVLLPEECR